MKIKSYREVYLDRIDKAETDDEIRVAYGEILQYEREIESYPDFEGGSFSAEERVRQNLGYILGYYSSETYQRWYALLPEVSHPIFGKSFGRGYTPTVDEALEAGRKMAEVQP